MVKVIGVYCPSWMYDVAATRVAYEFLHSEMPMETFSEKYSQGLNASFNEVPAESLLGAAQGMLEFLSEIEAGEGATDLLLHFTYFRLYFARIGVPRKMKSMFGSIEDPVKQKEYSEELVKKAFRAHIYRLRTNPEDMAPSGWKLEDDEHIEAFGELVRKQVSLLDAL